MAWFHDYDRDMGRNRGNTRAGGYRRDFAGWRGNSYGYDRDLGTGRRWSTTADRGYSDAGAYGAGQTGSGYGRDYMGRRYGYGYDYEVRRRPEESPFYGRQADQGLQRWARRYGYDLQYEIQPRRNTGGFAGSNRGEGFGATSRNRGWRQQGGYGRTPNLPNRDYNW